MRYTKILIILRDSPTHTDYNRRIIDYLNDRHTAINDNNFTIAIEVADETNINEFVANGVESVPAMQVHRDEPYIYGVNSIISALAQLEIIESVQETHQKKSFQQTSRMPTIAKDPSNAFYDIIMEEMNNKEPEDPDAPSTMKAYHQDMPETPLNDNSIADKMKAFEGLYQKKSKYSREPKPVNARATNAPATHMDMDMDVGIKNSKFDKDEERMIREITNQC